MEEVVGDMDELYHGLTKTLMKLFAVDRQSKEQGYTELVKSRSRLPARDAPF